MTLAVLREIENRLETYYHIKVKLEDADDNLRHHIIGIAQLGSLTFGGYIRIQPHFILSLICICNLCFSANLLMAYDLTWKVESIPVLIGKHTQLGHTHVSRNK